MKISVVIPCHNAERYIGQAIGSLVEQTRPPQEIIVVDDRSIDASLEIAGRFGPPVRILAASFGNASLARTYGYERSQGDAVLFFDADDVLAPGSLEALETALNRDPAGVAACPWERLEMHNGLWVRQPPSCPPRRRGQDPLTAWLRGWYHPTSSVLWTRRAYETAGGWRPLPTNQDGDLMMRALVRKIPLRLTSSGTLYYRRQPEDAVSVSGTRFTESGLRARIAILEDIAGELKETGRLDRYRSVLDDALKSIASDCHPDNEHLIAECARRRWEFGRRWWQRPLQPARRAARAMRELAVGTPGHGSGRTRQEKVESGEIRYGEEAMRAAGLSLD